VNFAPSNGHACLYAPPECASADLSFKLQKQPSEDFRDFEMKKIHKLIIVPHTPRDTAYGPKEALAFCVKMIVSFNEGSPVDVV